MNEGLTQDRKTHGELVVRLLDVSLEVREAVSVPVEVDVVEVASTGTGVDHLLKPVKALSSGRAGSDSWKGFFDCQRVDVLLVPRSGGAGANVGGGTVGLVQAEDGYVFNL